MSVSAASASRGSRGTLAMRYDSLGFPIPPGFDGPVVDEAGRPPSARRRAAGPGRGKRRLVAVLLAAVVVPGLVLPALVPTVREVVVRWSVQRAFGCEARGQSAAAAGAVGRALAWSGDDARLAAELLCWRARLRLDDRDATGAIADATRAIELVPTSAMPRRMRALAQVVVGRHDEALADAEAAVGLAGPGDPDALNHRAYIRALVSRDLPAALADIDSALAGGAEAAPEHLDTRGYVLHLLGRNEEAIDDLNRAIAAVDARRRDAAARARRGDRVGAKLEVRSLDHDLAVMHRHRGLACRAMGLEAQAVQDLEIAERKGYDPSRGIM